MLVIGNLKLKNVKNRSANTLAYDRKVYVPISEGINAIRTSRNTITLKLHKSQITKNVKKFDTILNNYNKNKCYCEICGLEANYFAIERDSLITTNSPMHCLHLYGISPLTNTEVMFNIDHIKPVSKGGKNNNSNLQLTCENCNKDKSDRFDDNKIVTPTKIQQPIQPIINKDKIKPVTTRKKDNLFVNILKTIIEHYKK